MKVFGHFGRMLALAGCSAGMGVWLAGAAANAAASPQEPQGEIIGTIVGSEGGQGLAVKGPMSVQVVGNDVKTLLRSGVDIRVKAGRARIDLVEGGTIAICGPAHVSMLKSGNGLTVALDSGTIHAHVEGNLTLNIFTAQILAKAVAIGDGPQDVLMGFDSPGLLCVRAGQGAVHLEEQFGGQSVMVPQGGDVSIANGQLQGLRNGSGMCACDSFEAKNGGDGRGGAELSVLATAEEAKKTAGLKGTGKTEPSVAAPQKAPTPAAEPSYQVFMPPLRYDASAKVQDEPDPKMIVLVRRVRVRPTLIFSSRVEGEAATIALKTATEAPPLNEAGSKSDARTAKPSVATNASVVDRVKSFFKSLW